MAISSSSSGRRSAEEKCRRSRISIRRKVSGVRCYVSGKTRCKFYNHFRAWCLRPGTGDLFIFPPSTDPLSARECWLSMTLDVRERVVRLGIAYLARQPGHELPAEYFRSRMVATHD